MAHCVHIVLQVTFSIIRQYNASQFAISSKVETGISGEHQQTRNIPPANFLLINKKENILSNYQNSLICDT